MVQVSIDIVPSSKGIICDGQDVITSSRQAIPQTMVQLRFRPVANGIVLRPLARYQVYFHVRMRRILELFQPVIPTGRVRVRVAFSVLCGVTILRRVLETWGSFLFSVPGYSSSITRKLFTANLGDANGLRRNQCAQHVIINSIMSFIAYRYFVGARVVRVHTCRCMLVNPFSQGRAWRVDRTRQTIHALLRLNGKVEICLPATFLLPFLNANFRELMV